MPPDDDAIGNFIGNFGPWNFGPRVRTWEYRYATINLHSSSSPTQTLGGGFEKYHSYTLHNGEITETSHQYQYGIWRSASTKILDHMHMMMDQMIYIPSYFDMEWEFISEYQLSEFPSDRFFLFKQRGTHLNGVDKKTSKEWKEFHLFYIPPTLGIGGREIPFQLPEVVDAVWFFYDFLKGGYDSMRIPRKTDEDLLKAIFNLHDKHNGWGEIYSSI